MLRRPVPVLVLVWGGLLPLWKPVGLSCLGWCSCVWEALGELLSGVGRTADARAGAQRIHARAHSHAAALARFLTLTLPNSALLLSAPSISHIGLSGRIVSLAHVFLSVLHIFE